MARITRFGSVPHRNGSTLNFHPTPEHIETIGIVLGLVFERKRLIPAVYQFLWS
jgi:hypothetical protein